MAVVIALMIIFPPYEIIGFRQITIEVGYGFLLDLPVHGVIAASVNVKTLLMQIVGVFSVGGLVFFASS